MEQQSNKDNVNNKIFGNKDLFSSLQNDGVKLTNEQIQKARNGDEKTFYTIGKLYHKQRNYPKALAWYRKAAIQDDWRAQKEMGWMYRAGLGGITADRYKSVEWFIKATMNSENKYAQNNIGYMYFYGEDGVTENIHTAIEWYTKAANQGCEDAQFGLGSIYFNYLKDLQKAVEWYKMAADNGLLYSFIHLKSLNDLGYYPKEEEESVTMDYNGNELGQSLSTLDKLKLMTENTTIENLYSILKYDGFQLTSDEIQKAINNDGKTLHKIGTRYYKKKDYYQALSWYRRAAQQNYWQAHNEIGYLYLAGLGVTTTNSKMAMKHFIKAANLSGNNKNALRSMGDVYRSGSFNTIKDIPTAIEWLTKAANQGSENAQYNLGYIYEEEMKDIKKAIYWYAKAADNGSLIPFCVLRRLNELGYYVEEDNVKSLENTIDSKRQDPLPEKKIKKLEKVLQSYVKLAEKDKLRQGTIKAEDNSDTEDDEDRTNDLNFDD